MLAISYAELVEFAQEEPVLLGAILAQIGAVWLRETVSAQRPLGGVFGACALICLALIPYRSVIFILPVFLFGIAAATMLPSRHEMRINWAFSPDGVTQGVAMMIAALRPPAPKTTIRAPKSATKLAAKLAT